MHSKDTGTTEPRRTYVLLLHTIKIQNIHQGIETNVLQKIESSLQLRMMMKAACSQQQQRIRL
jgi:hypothetical protein